MLAFVTGMDDKMQLSVASEKILGKVRGRFYNANMCLSNLIFLFPFPTLMKICMIFTPLVCFQDAGQDSGISGHTHV